LYYDSEEEVYVEHRSQNRYREVLSSKAKAASPLSSKLEKADWPQKFKLPASLPEYDGESDPRQFLQKYTVALSSGGGDDVAAARAMIMALMGSTQKWYASLPKGSIKSSWEQLRQRIENNFQGYQPQDLTSGDLPLIKQGDKEPLQEYIKRFTKARAKEPYVNDTTVIDAAIDGLKVGPCGEYLDRRRPKTTSSCLI
jgi:hypothetical protein